jgi:Kef-type K+ transport system membrane component KefB/voltage-gated potassium channel Kch
MPQELLTFLALLATVLGSFVICQKTRVSIAIGYLLSGIVLGPLGFGLFEKTPFLSILGQVGLLLFLFTVGLEIPFHRIRALRRYIFGFGLVQVFATSGVLFSITQFLMPWDTALILSIALSFSSTAVVVQLLSERYELTTQSGRTALSILLFQDIVAIGLFMMMGLSAAQNTDIWSAVGKGAFGLVLSVGLGFLLTRVTEKALGLYRYSEYITSFVILMLLGFSFLTEWFHLSSELGAFIAGIAMASTHWRHQISIELHPFRTLFLALFFIVMGLEIQAWPPLSSLGWILSGLIGISAIKVGIVMGCARWFQMQGGLSLGLLMGGCSEFLFMLVPSLKPILGAETCDGLLLMGLASMVITPMLFLVCKKMLSPKKGCEAGAHRQAVVIAGFGHVGQTIARILEHNFISFVIVDYDQSALDRARESNYPTLYGDARDIEFLKRMKIYESKVLLITFGHLTTAADIVRTLRRKFPDLSVCVQVRDYQETGPFMGLGAHLVVPESIESGMQMASMTLQCLGFSKDYSQKMAHFPAKPVFFGERL